MSALKPARAFGGRKLSGTRLVRVVYLDESGISLKEPIAVVAGAILEPDEHWFALEGDFMQINQDHVPGWQLGNSFYPFSAKDLFWGGDKKSAFSQKTTTDVQRWPILRKLLELPRKYQIPLAFGITEKPEKSGTHKSKIGKMSHWLTFIACVSAIDIYLRQRARKNEIAILVAEDAPTMSKGIKEARQGLTSPKRNMRYGGINRIRDAVYFAKKDEAIALQLADVTAFALRRFFQSPEKNEWLWQSLFGDAPLDRLKMEPGSTRILVEWDASSGEPKPKITLLRTPLAALLAQLRAQ